MPGAPNYRRYSPARETGKRGEAHSRAQYSIIYRLRINLQKKGNKSQNTGTDARENRIDSREFIMVSTVKRDFALLFLSFFPLMFFVSSRREKESLVRRF